jgi:6-phosphogluconolactonase
MENFLKNGRKVLIFSDKKSQADYAVNLWKVTAGREILKKGKFIVAISGGQSPVLFFETLAKKVEADLWEKTHVFFVDERFVPLNDEKSNFFLFHSKISSRLKTNIYPFFKEEDIQLCLRSYEKKIRDTFDRREIFFDLLFLGIGADGHTASLFSKKDLNIGERLLVIVKNDGESFFRMSFSLKLINQSKKIVFLVSGEEKAQIVKRILEVPSKDIPASQVRSKEGETLFLLDKEAGSLILS